MMLFNKSHGESSCHAKDFERCGGLNRSGPMSECSAIESGTILRCGLVKESVITVETGHIC